MKIYIVIIEDRHDDTEAIPFLNATTAICYAKKKAREYCRHEEDYGESLNDAMKGDGWLWHATYSCEGDSVRVIERDTDDA